MDFEPKQTATLRALVLVLALVTIILGLNEATVDALDYVGSNFWLAAAATLSGVILLVVALLPLKRSKKSGLVAD